MGAAGAFETMRGCQRAKGINHCRSPSPHLLWADGMPGMGSEKVSAPRVPSIQRQKPQADLTAGCVRGRDRRVPGP